MEFDYVETEIDERGVPVDEHGVVDLRASDPVTDARAIIAILQSGGPEAERLVAFINSGSKAGADQEK